MASALGKASSKAGIVRFTLLSVHCADKMTATISSYGLVYSNSVSATGRCLLKYSIIFSNRSFLVTSSIYPSLQSAPSFPTPSQSFHLHKLSLPCVQCLGGWELKVQDGK